MKVMLAREKAMQRFYVMLLCFVFFFAWSAQPYILAQGETETPEVTATIEVTPELTVTVVIPDPEDPPVDLPDEVPQPQDLVAAIYTAVLAVLLPVFNMPIHSTIVSFVKRIPNAFIQSLSVPAINLIVGAVVVLIIWLANVLGLRENLDTAFQIIVSVAGIVLGTKASAWWYNTVADGLPVLGTARPHTGEVTHYGNAQSE